MSWSYCEKNHRCYETDPTETQTKPFIKSDQTEYNPNARATLEQQRFQNKMTNAFKAFLLCSKTML